MTRLRLGAATPRDWYDTHLHAVLHQWDGDAVDDTQRRWYSGADAFADDLAILRAAHRAYLDEGATAQAAAKWVVGQHVDVTAGVMGVLYVAAGAVPVGLEPLALRFGTHPDGWTQLVDLGDPALVVVDGHPWAGLPGVAPVPDVAALVTAFRTTVETLTTTWYPAARRLGKVGVASLWAETADAIGMCTLHRPTMPAGQDVLADLRLLLDAPGAPWRKRPALWLDDVAGAEHLLGQKGGCCLAYLGGHDEVDDGEAGSGEDDPFAVAYRQRFPSGPDDPTYCTTCCFRDRSDVRARLRFDLEWESLASVGDAHG